MNEDGKVPAFKRDAVRIIQRTAEEVLRVFFFSSRRRHTRFDCDWSSDVCSSDLVLPAPLGPIKAWIVPRRTARSTPLTATKPLNSLVRPWVASIVSSAICPVYERQDRKSVV